jgi:hypothetical protein
VLAEEVGDALRDHRTDLASEIKELRIELTTCNRRWKNCAA